MELLGILLGVAAIWVVISAVDNAAGKALAQRFADLGNLVDRSETEIIAAVGPPTAISGAENASKVLQWLATGYHTVLLFDAAGKCQGVTHEAMT